MIFHTQPAELNSNECITGHFTQLRMVRVLCRPLLYIPYRYAFAKLCLSLANHVKTAFKLSLQFQVMLEPIWPVYNVNVFFFFCFSNVSFT